MKEIKLGLPAGARVLEAKDYNPRNPADKNLSVVLCHWEGHGMPYVTWMHHADASSNPNESWCYDGHYFVLLSEAAQDFENRGVK